MTTPAPNRPQDAALPTVEEIERAMKRGRALRSKAANDALRDLTSDLRRIMVDARRVGAPQSERRAV